MDKTSIEPYHHVAVLGGGAWGTALAHLAAQAGTNATLYARNADVAADINATHRNTRYLPGIPLNPAINATNSLAEAVSKADAILIVTPSRTVREICEAIAPSISPNTPVALCCKGIEAKTGKLLHQVTQECLPSHPIGAVSGPTFAKEAASGHPTAVTVAFEGNAEAAPRLALSFTSETFRPYISDDLTGVEVGGAVKNVIAIACGMMSGAGFAENTKAALITRGLGEMMTLGTALGANPLTFAGLSGVGDLTLTCSSPTSRNMSLGLQLGQGRARQDCFDGKPVVVEGEVNAQSVMDLATRIGVEMPICSAVNAVLHQCADLAQTFAALWTRPIRGEQPGSGIKLSHPSDIQSVLVQTRRRP